MRKIKLSQAIAAVLLAAPLLASADSSSLVTNSSFELPTPKPMGRGTSIRI